MLTADYQLLEPGAEVQMLEVDCTGFGGDMLRFHAHDAGPIIWQGHVYQPWPCALEGAELTGHGAAPTPTLSLANVDLSITALCLHFNDLTHAKVTIRETFSHYLDADNFPSGNAKADPEQEAISIWYIDHKASENDEMVVFSLSSPADLDGQMLPARQIHSLCQWAITGGYRGPDCGYLGTAKFTETGEVTDDPALDKCGGCLHDCKKRFGEHEELPFGGFPASSLIRA